MFFFVERHLDFGERGGGAGGQYQFLRLVFQDARESREIEGAIDLHRTAHGALAAAAYEFNRMHAGDGPFDRLNQLIDGAGCERLFH